MTPLDLVAEYFESQAYYKIIFDRDDQDNYNIHLSPLRFTHKLSTNDIFPLIPKGGRWIQSLGWHSYFGAPLETHSALWLSVGVELICKHPTRGAFPISCIYLFPFKRPPVEALQRFADSIKPVDRGSHSNCEALDSGVISTQSQTPQEHTYVESRIVQDAARRYRNGEAFLFRTAVLSEDAIRNMPQSCSRTNIFDHPLWAIHLQADPRPQVFYSRFIMATVPPIREAFSEEVSDWLSTSTELD